MGGQLEFWIYSHLKYLLISYVLYGILKSYNKYMQYHLKVATLNFSGINISPFEYHDGSQQKNILDRTFRAFLDRYNHEHPKTPWNIAKLDKVFQKERYTILYQPDCGCVRGKLLTKEQFEIVWDRTFDMNQAILTHMNLNDQSINHLRCFDFMIYQSYLSALFGDVDMNRLDQYDVTKYTDQLKKWHSKSYLNMNLKITYIKEYILKQELDVLFLQEALTERGKQFLPNDSYSFVKNADSMIIFKRENYFLQDYKDSAEFDEKYRHQINFNRDSCYLKCKDVLLMSVHLSSKQAHIQQAKQMFEKLGIIERQNKDLKIILGIDANHKLNSFKSFEVFPQTAVPTTRKKRTTLQCQFQKANKLIEQSKDFIITNVSISSSRIQTIRSWEATNDLLPNDGHPFDHFVVSANLEFDKPTFRSRACSFLKTFANPIKILIEETSKQSTTRSFEDIIGQLVAHIVPPEAANPFKGIRTNNSPSTTNFINANIHRNLSTPRLMNPLNLDDHHMIKWQFLKKTNIEQLQR